MRPAVWVCASAWLLGCGEPSRVATPTPPVRPAPPAIHVTADGAPLAMQSELAVVDEVGDVEVYFSSQAQTCAMLETDAQRPGEVSFTYQLGRVLHADGSSGWAMRGYGYPTGTSFTATASLGDEIAGASVEPVAGGHVRFTIAGDGDAPFAIHERLGVRGPVDATVCPRAPTPAPPAALGSGTIEIAGKRYALTTARLERDERVPNGAWRTLRVEVLGAGTCKDVLPDSALALVLHFDAGGRMKQIELDGDWMAHAAVASGEAFTFAPGLDALAPGRLRIRGRARAARRRRARDRRLVHRGRGLAVRDRGRRRGDRDRLPPPSVISRSRA